MPYLKAGTRDFKASWRQNSFGIEGTHGMRDAKISMGLTGLKNPMGIP